MKKWWIIGIAGFVAILGGVLAVVLCKNSVDNNGATDGVTEKFALPTEMYDRGEVVEITASEFDALVAEQKSFVVILHMVICPAEFPVTNSGKELAHNEELVIYSMVEEEFKQTTLAKTIKYLPSVAILHEGKLVDYLDAEADEDLPYYKTAEGLKMWLERWVKF